MVQLRNNLKTIHDKFYTLYGVEAGDDFAIEIEYKITAQNKLAIKQARPWVFPGELDLAPTVTLTLTQDGTTVTEGTALELVVTRTGGIPSVPVTINLAWIETSSMLPQSRPSSVTIPANETEARTTFLTQADETDEPDSTIGVEIKTSNLYKIGTPSSGNVTVTDDDKTKVSLRRTADIVFRGAPVEFVVSRTRGDGLVAPLTVALTVTDADDIVVGAKPTSVTLAAGEASATLSLPTKSPPLRGKPSTVKVELQPGNGLDLVGSRSASVRVQRKDTSRRVIFIEPGDAVTEGSDAVFTITVNPAPLFGIYTRIEVTQQGDFTTATSVRDIHVPRGGIPNLRIPTINDTTVEDNGSITVKVLTNGLYFAGTPNEATVAVKDNDSGPVQPAVKITGGAAVTEGGNAEFTLSASPTPSSPLAVTVDLAAKGNYGVATGARTVTIPTSGTATLNVATTGDAVDEPNGSVTATIASSSDYTMGSPISATVAVNDDDAPGPEISIASDGDVTEGTAASFTVPASPAPSVNLPVSVSVTASGDYGVTTGAQTVTIPPTGSVKLTLATTGDTTDEPDGSVTATVQTGTGYTVSTTDGAATVAVQDDDNPPPATPVISIASDGDVTEGTAASFTVSASPAPQADLPVSVSVTASGDYGVTTGAQTVTIPTTGSVKLTLATTGDTTDEPDGSVTAPLQTGNDYDVGSSSAATVTVSDDDDPPQVCTVTPTASSLVFTVRSYHDGNKHRTNYDHNWFRVLIAFGAETHATLQPFTAAEARTEEQIWDGWTPVRVELERLEDEQAQCTGTQTQVPATPVVSITGGAAVTEGGSAVFTLSASPAPTASLSVSVNVTATGAYGVTTGVRTVTIPSSGTTTLSLSTTGDTTDEPHGSVTVTLQSGNGYSVGSASAATVTVQDDDDPPPQTPVVSITGVSSVIEGGSAVFTLSASPAPTASLSVSVNVTATGAYGVTTGAQTVTIPTSGTATLSLSTTGDTTDEPHGSVTVTLQSGNGYSVGSASAATVSVQDDDDPPPSSVEPGKVIIEWQGEVLGDGDVVQVPLGGSTEITVRFSSAPSRSASLSLLVWGNQVEFEASRSGRSWQYEFSITGENWEAGQSITIFGRSSGVDTVYGTMLGPADIDHRSFPDFKVKVP